VADGDGGGWNLQRKDALYALALAAGVGSGFLHQGADGAVERQVEINSGRLTALEQQGSPVVRSLEALLKADEQRISVLEAAQRSAAEARLSDLRGGVSQTALDEVRRRIEEYHADSKAADLDLSKQLREAVDRLSGSLQTQLRGPER